MQVSIIIPYKDRLNNLILCLNSLNKQTVQSDKYEIIIGSLDEIYTLQEINNRYKNIKIICKPQNLWNPSLARNIALRNALGDKIILLDADIIVNNNFVEKHLFFSSPYEIVVGSVCDYDENAENISQPNICTDIRWSINPNKAPFKWALCWSGNVAFSNSVLKKGLFFDENFVGWGGEDLEWAYRLHINGYRFLFTREIEGKHIPHQRDVKKNRKEESLNFEFFSKKYKSKEVDFVVKHGDLGANRKFSEFDNFKEKQR